MRQNNIRPVNIDNEALRYEKGGLWVGSVTAACLDRNDGGDSLIGLRLGGNQAMVGNSVTRLVLDGAAAAALIAHIQFIADGMGTRHKLNTDAEEHRQHLHTMDEELQEADRRRADIGRIAFEAYAAKVGGRSLATGRTLAPWGLLPAVMREAWTTGALAAAEAYGEVRAERSEGEQQPRSIFEETEAALRAQEQKHFDTDAYPVVGDQADAAAEVPEETRTGA